MDKTILMELDGEDIIDLEILENSPESGYSSGQSAILDTEKLASEFQSSMSIFSDHVRMSKHDSMHFGEFLQNLNLGGGGSGQL